MPFADGTLQPPRSVVFEEISPAWNDSPILRSKIAFRPRIVDSLAKELGMEADIFMLLKEHGLTTVAELRSRLGITEDQEGPAPTHDEPEIPVPRPHLAQAAQPGTPPRTTHLPVPDQQTDNDGPESGDIPRVPEYSPSQSTRSGTSGYSLPDSTERSPARPTTMTTSTRSSGATPASVEFISYVAVHPSNQEQDADVVGSRERLDLEEASIELVLNTEPVLVRTPANNPGFDLFEPDHAGKPDRWIEVKAMTGTLDDRPVALSRTQFECAQSHGDQFWLYIVEHAESLEQARIRRIQDPAGRARAFTFDRGWGEVAETVQPSRSE